MMTGQDIDEQTPQNSEDLSGESRPFLQRIPPVPFALLALGVVFVLYQGLGGLITFVLFSADLSAENANSIRIATLVGQVGLLLIPTLYLAQQRRMRLFIFQKVSVKQVLLVVVGVVALQQLLEGYLVLQDSIPLPPIIKQFVDLFKELLEKAYRVLIVAQSPWEFVIVVIVVALTPAICEELLFRGLVQQSLSEVLGGAKAAIIAGIIFGMYHLNPFALIPLCTIGVYMGIIVHYSGNLSIAIIAHFVNNFFASLAAYLNVEEDALVSKMGAEWSAAELGGMYLVVGVVFVAATRYFVIESKLKTHTSAA